MLSFLKTSKDIIKKAIVYISSNTCFAYIFPSNKLKNKVGKVIRNNLSKISCQIRERTLSM